MALVQQGEGSIKTGRTSAQISAARKQAQLEAAQKAATLAARATQAAKPVPVVPPVGTIGSSALKTIAIPESSVPQSVPNTNAYANAGANIVGTNLGSFTPDSNKSALMAQQETYTPPIQTSFTPDGNKSAAMAAAEAGISQQEINAADYIPQTQIQSQPFTNPDTPASQNPNIIFGSPQTRKDNTGGGNKTGISGSGSSRIGSSGGTGTGTGIASTTGTTDGTQAPPWKEYFDKAMNTQFAYDPATDNSYRQAASTLENQVTQMMVGRGGLYSSVAQSSLTSRLIDLQVTYQKTAYDNFKAEQDYYMKAASFVADRSDAEFNKNMTIAKFQADMQQQKYENNFKEAQFRVSQANASYSRQIAGAKASQAKAQSNLSMQMAQYQGLQNQYQKLASRWANDGVADYEVAKYFNVGVGADINNYQNRIYKKESELSASANSLSAMAQSIGDSEAYLYMLNGFQTEKEADASSKASSKAEQDNDYVVSLSSAMGLINSGSKTAIEVFNQAINNRDIAIATMGSSNYNKLIETLDKKVDSEK